VTLERSHAPPAAAPPSGPLPLCNSRRARRRRGAASYPSSTAPSTPPVSERRPVGPQSRGARPALASPRPAVAPRRALSRRARAGRVPLCVPTVGVPVESVQPPRVPLAFSAPAAGPGPSRGTAFSPALHAIHVSACVRGAYPHPPRAAPPAPLRCEEEQYNVRAPRWLFWRPAGFWLAAGRGAAGTQNTQPSHKLPCSLSRGLLTPISAGAPCGAHDCARTTAPKARRRGGCPFRPPVRAAGGIDARPSAGEAL
jgi:hypothetical protein